MDCLIQQRAGWEPTQFFDKDELRATDIDAPSFAEVNQHYRYDKALNTLETKDKGEQHFFTLNRNNQITAVHNQNREQERYAYDECGYLTQRYVGSETYGLIQNPYHPKFHEQRQIIPHQDIYQKGHKLHRLNKNYYEYDKAGRLVTKVEKRDSFRKQETDYRWNGKNELIGITTPKGEVWHYKYDALGRRIAKECPQQHLRIEYLWDGDQLAYTQIFKNNELISERHSIFNGFELIAQQDNYQTLKQTIDGNFIEWKQETGYAICQPNGQVLALLNPKGRTLWRKEKQTLWGLLFSNEYKYRQSNPLDPQMLFAGQYFDKESGLAYNRFRYYDPETACYLNSDPIGLQGGETPYSYVFNPLNCIDQFGLAICPARYERYKQFRAQGKSAQLAAKLSKIPNTVTGVGYGINDTPVRIQGKWSNQDIYNGLMGRSPKGLGSPDLHHAHQMPGSAIHEILPNQHRGNIALHPNKYNQGVTPQMRNSDRQLHWWYRAREQGADKIYPDLIYD
ncbi:RHS repeat-associated core domain-containing protein [Pelistega sp. NLN82]|uniref:RHS repeat-associated core domain-containing protein n=1 Tax=Pelistega ratti TaxID=2652177 RepID=A0A6L9Y6G6_9BURK|nr:RHS repeat-associated core domain-containing protein [Pelistega ratti]NEN75795.1 RHS repeat-associated core domain-containing protein [Pelistega ratti]